MCFKWYDFRNELYFELYFFYSILSNSPSIIIKDDILNNVYPLVTEANGTDNVYIGRIRRDFSQKNTLNLWVVADNIRKGAATNAIQILEKILEKENNV